MATRVSPPLATSAPPSAATASVPPREARCDRQWTRARRRGREESGVIMVVTAILLVAMIGLAALAIDVGSFYRAQRQAQAAADAGALAGADAIAAGSSTAQAQTTATSMATTNYGGASATATASTTAVTVSVSASTPSFFGRILGMVSANVSARAVAAAGASSTTCKTAGNNCYAIWASDHSCSNPTPVSFTGGGYTINGGIHSNGGMSPGGGGSTFGPTTYGTSCSAPSGGGTYASGPTAQAPNDTWPLDYSKTYPACGAGGSYTYHCTGPSGTPSYCNYAASSYTVTSTPTQGIYCAYGSGTPSDPSTYTGAVSLNNGGYAVTASYLCGTFTIGSGVTSLTAYNYPTNQLVVYAAATSGNAVNIGGGGFAVTGDVFAPNATISINAGITGTNFLEGKDVSLNAGGYSVSGDGPPDTSGSSTTSNSSLTQ